MSFGSAEAFQADVVFRTNVSQFEGDQAQIRALAERTYGALDAGSLKAALASEKYDRALARSKGSAFAVAKATAAYKAELAALEGAENRAAGGTARHTGALKAEERAFGGVIRGGIAGSGVLNRFGRAAIFASTSVLGGYGLIYALRSTIGAAREEGVALAHLQGALDNSGLSWDRNRNQIERARASLVKVTGFTDNELTESLATTIRRFGDVNQAIHTTALAADVARQKGISLVDATNLLIRASLGQSRSAKTLGVDVAATTANVDALRASTKNATAEQIAAAKAADQQASRLGYLSAIQAKYHGDAARFLTTDAGKQALFNAELDRSEEIIGGALLPTFNHYLEQGSKYLDHLNKTGELQRDVNKVLHTTETVVHDVTGAIKFVDGATGGFKNTLELLLALKAGAVIGGWAVGIGKFAGALRKLAGAEKAVAGANVAAEITGIGGAATAAEAEVAGLRGGLLGLGALGAIDVPIVVTASLIGGGAFALKKFMDHEAGVLKRAVTIGPGAAGDPFSDKKREQLAEAADARWMQEHPNATRDPHTFEWYYNHPAADQQLLEGGSTYVGKSPQGARTVPNSGTFSGTTLPPGSTRTGGGGGGDGAGGGLPYSLQNALLEAQGTPGTADDMKVLNDQLGYLNQALARKGLTPADRNQLLSERNDVLSQRDQIMQAATQAQKQAAAAAARKQKQRFSALSHVPAALVKRFADAEAAHKPKGVLEAIRRQEIAALQRQEKTLKSDHAPESYIATIAKEIDAIQGKIDAAIRKARKARIDKLDAVPVNLRIAEANAIANNASAERLAAIYRKEKDALDKQLVQLKKIHATKQEILKNRQAAAAVEKKLTAIEKQQKADTGALARELQDAVAGLAQYAPNVTEALASIQGGPSVTVNQHFPHPPTDDGSREAIFARHSLLAAFDG
jgi:hypothetical protein